jgi:hypothetical protein
MLLLTPQTAKTRIKTEKMHLAQTTQGANY